MDKTLQRYAPYVPAWRQAFGEHLADPRGPGQPVEWLIGTDAVGAIIAPRAPTAPIARLLGMRPPELELGPHALRLDGLTFDDEEIVGQPGYAALRELLHDLGPTHMFETSHLIYPAGTRIITFSRRAPMRLLYRRLAPLPIGLIAPASMGQR